MRRFVIYLYGSSYVVIGSLHFTDPELFVPIVPELIGFPLFWVYLSGIFEIAVGAGLWFPQTRRKAACLLIPMLAVLYTANLNMWWNDIPFNGVVMTSKAHLLRGMVQLILVVCALWVGSLWPFEDDSSVE
ncbi:MAG: hypothetical protein CMK59_13470 [Proteobacteria bacterium]|nr:hypothetical protein [Pseudomonadota bacterium]